MQRTRPSLFVLACGLALAAAPGLSHAAPVLTGNAEVDFTGPDVVVLQDGTIPDVGAPPAWNAIPGWDLKDLRLRFSGNSVAVALNTWGIAGDADGDGDPSRTSQALINRGGKDHENFASSESFAVCFDFDEDAICDVIAGIPNLGSDAFTLARYQPSAFLSDDAFGTPLSAYGAAFFGVPTAAAPDLEFTIADFRALSRDHLSSGSDAAPTFSMQIYLGSFQDDGIGEDSASFVATLPPAAAVPLPPALGLIVTGLAALGWTMRSRRPARPRRDEVRA